MKAVNLQGAPVGNGNEWLINAIRQLAQASQENDTIDIAQNFTFTGTFTETRALNVSSPTLANLAAVIATLISDLQKGGANRTT